MCQCRRYPNIPRRILFVTTSSPQRRLWPDDAPVTRATADQRLDSEEPARDDALGDLRTRRTSGGWAIAMGIVVRCHNCSHGEFACDELRKGQRCPHCGSVPGSYCVDGTDFCWLHQEPISAQYSVSANNFFT